MNSGVSKCRLWGMRDYGWGGVQISQDPKNGIGIYPASVFSQITMEGTVQDKQNAPVAYASTSYVNGKGGTIGNELRQFVLNHTHKTMW